MTQYCMLGISVLVTCLLLEAAAFPSSSEVTTSVENLTDAPDEKAVRSLTYDETGIENDKTAKDIIQKIIRLNEAIKKPSRRHPVPWKSPPPVTSDYVLDKDILEKLQQVIASGKIHPYQNNVKQQEINTISQEDIDNIRFSRQLSPLFANSQITVPAAPTAYITSMPVLVMPSTNNRYGYGNLVNPSQYQSKEGPSPFQPFQFFQDLGFQWPLAPFFPILVRDPLLNFMSGGGFQQLFEVGQSADVCNRKQKSEENLNILKENKDLQIILNHLSKSSSKRTSRAAKLIKKRTVSLQNQLPAINNAKKFFAIKPVTAKPIKPEPINKITDEEEGDLRFPFLFGNKEKIPSGPGIVINRLRVRNGGVAIAGPGGVATAGQGGTAIVGPGGLAYTQPGGVAVAGPAARVIALSSDADLTSVANRLQQQSMINGSVSSFLQAIPEGKVVAMGPVIYFHPNI